MKNLYTNQQATVRTKFGNTSGFGIGQRVRQGCILSPCVLNLYAEQIKSLSNLEELNAGIRIGGLQLNDIMYVMQTTLN